MKKDINLNSDAWCKLVFEGKNQKYGAYYLRKTSSKRHLWALFIMVILCTTLILLSILLNLIQTKDTENSTIRPIELSNLIMKESFNEENLIIPIDKPLIKEVLKFTPPEIVKDDDIVNIQEELAETKALTDSIKTDSILIENLSMQQKESELVKKTGIHTMEETDNNDSIPEFPGGRAALLRYIYQNIHYPPVASKQRIKGRVICSFIINEDGLVSDIALVQGVYVFLDEEVLRVTRSMPIWKPAMKKGKAFKVKYYMPVEFRL